MQKIKNGNTNIKNSNNKDSNKNNNDNNRETNSQENTNNTDSRYMKKLIKLKQEEEKYVRRDHWREYETRTKTDKFAGDKRYVDEYRHSRYTPTDGETDMTSDDINEATIIEQALMYSRTDDEQILKLDNQLAISYLETFHSKNFNTLWKSQIKAKKKHERVVKITMVICRNVNDRRSISKTYFLLMKKHHD